MRILIGTPEQEAMSLILHRLGDIGEGYGRNTQVRHEIERLLRLIAAAPEMYDQLRTVADLARIYGQGRTVTPDTLAAIGRGARDLITRIENGGS